MTKTTSLRLKANGACEEKEEETRQDILVHRISLVHCSIHRYTLSMDRMAWTLVGYRSNTSPRGFRAHSLGIWRMFARCTVCF